jgi:UDP:flavonoid glycosyltransferase YjiC (YdhE family)
VSGLRVIVGVIGLAGHALPAIALARELRARGHEVRFHTPQRWRGVVEDLGLVFAGGGEDIVSGVGTGAGDRDATPAEIARALLPSMREFRPDVVVSDALTLTPALAAEVEGIPRVSLFPEVYPAHEAGLPFFSLGLFPPRTALGAAAWRAAAPLVGTRLPTTRWLRRSLRALNDERAKLGLPPHGRFGESRSEELTLVATYPQLEYPRNWPPGVHVTGPMFFDLPHPSVRPPEGEAPMVLIAPSTVKDPGGRLVRAALEALAEEPVRVLVSTSGAKRSRPERVPSNAVVADWLDYSRLMREASLVVSHGTHGTIVRALSEGVPLAVSPAMPDDAEHGARVAWSGAGLMIPKPLLGRRSLRVVTRRLLSDSRFGRRAGAIAAWGRERDGAARGADLLERHAAVHSR